AAEETVLRIESRPGVSEVMVLTPGKLATEVANEVANERGSEPVAGQRDAKNVVIVLEGGSGQIRIGKKSCGGGRGQVKRGGAVGVRDRGLGVHQDAGAGGATPARRVPAVQQHRGAGEMAHVDNGRRCAVAEAGSEERVQRQRGA